MTKFFESRLFNSLLIIAFVISLWSVYKYSSWLGINDAPSIIVSSVLMLLATLIAISLPIYAALQNDKKRIKEDTKMVYIAVSRYIGNEILDNLIQIEDVLATNKKSDQEIKNRHPEMPDEGKKVTNAAMWRAVGEELLASLEEKQHQSMIMSGLVAKIPDDEVGNGIRDTYQKMDNLKKRLRNFVIFSGMLLQPPPNLPPEVIQLQMDTKLPKAIKAVQLDIEIFQTTANNTVKAINRLLKPYGKKIEIVKYESKKKRKKRNVK